MYTHKKQIRIYLYILFLVICINKCKGQKKQWRLCFLLPFIYDTSLLFCLDAVSLLAAAAALCVSLECMLGIRCDIKHPHHHHHQTMWRAPFLFAIFKIFEYKLLQTSAIIKSLKFLLLYHTLNDSFRLWIYSKCHPNLTTRPTSFVHVVFVHCSMIVSCKTLVHWVCMYMYIYTH